MNILRFSYTSKNFWNSIIKIKFIKQIQAHKGEITLIEINKRLGVIITGGKDNTTAATFIKEDDEDER